MAFDRGQYETAIDFLRKRYLNIYSEEPTARWIPGAKYNLGRVLEAKGLEQDDQAILQAAIAIYQSDTDSAQTHQAHWRAAQLKQQINE